jgi:hypothetical protein
MSIGGLGFFGLMANEYVNFSIPPCIKISPLMVPMVSAVYRQSSWSKRGLNQPWVFMRWE